MIGELDAVRTLTPGVSGVAVRNVTSTSAIFATHFPRFPVLPGVLLLNDFAQLAALVLAGDDRPDRWTPAVVSRVRFRRYVRPGDVVELAVHVKADDPGRFKGTATVDGAAVATVADLVMTQVSGGQA